MALNLTLKPFERLIVNGCMLRNGGRKTTITVETRASIIREADLLRPEEANTPVKSVYFLIQSALIDPDRRQKTVKAAQQELGVLANVFSSELRPNVFEAANNVSVSNYFGALRNLRPLLKREAEILGPAEKVRA
ncbi:flagellar biosynthesis repressor FlbT [Marinovum sp. KMM 9879]